MWSEENDAARGGSLPPPSRPSTLARHVEVFTSFGVTLAVEVIGTRQHPLVAAVTEVLPPGRTPPTARDAVVASFTIAAGDGTFTVSSPGSAQPPFSTEHDAIHALDREIRAIVTVAAPHHAFVHAGAVLIPEGAIVIPGRSFTGKTTLVGALVRAGASYLSDEYAVLDATGQLWPYPRHLSFRTPDGRLDVPATELGEVAGADAVPVVAIVSTSFQGGARWQPAEEASAGGALALLDNAVAARVRSADVLSMVVAAADGARCFRGPRGEADETAEHLLRVLRGALPMHPSPTEPQRSAPRERVSRRRRPSGAA